MSAGGSFTCALDRAGRIACWGRNARGQLGNGTLQTALEPIAVPGERRFRDVTAGGEHACALDDLGRAYCWGANDSGQSGLTSRGEAREPARVQGEILFRSLSAGLAHTCGVGELAGGYCWGSNEGFALGDPAFTDDRRFGPAPVGGRFRFRAIEAGWGSWSCGTTDADELLCWGSTDSGGFGIVGHARLRGPVPLALGRWKTIDVGAEHLCGVPFEQGTVHCWGMGGSGQLGTGSRADRSAPTPVGG